MTESNIEYQYVGDMVKWELNFSYLEFSFDKNKVNPVEIMFICCIFNIILCQFGTDYTDNWI